MNYGNIKECDIANGEGVRTSLFVSGCRRHCKNCFQPETWDFSYGQPFTQETVDTLIESIEPSYVHGLSILGGEPMEPENQEALAGLIGVLHERCPEKTIWLFSGYPLEDLQNGPQHTEYTDAILAGLDVLVDGPFIEEEHDVTLRFRGSKNQRIIDMKKTLAAGSVVLWEDCPEFSTHSM